MGRIKINLDQLEEVRKQNEIAMNATEEVIGKAREDLASMTEEVWEGEDGDIARELLGDLVYKEMPETWKHIDGCHEALKKAQKSAYEAKNYCNDFPKIFSGWEPNDNNQFPCSGELLCDSGSCAELKHNMAEAGKNATNLKRHIEEVESILSQLETPEAKFDYSSYTEPIKKQAQDVTDYTGNFNVALTKYEAKVKELDDTLAKELIAAVPETVLKAFDPSCLLGGDTIHMQGGDIIDTLEAHNSIDIGGKLSDAQLENILAMLFDKKDIDVSGLSREDFEVAFLNLPEEKQKAILMEMGLTRRQIDSILESKESKRSFVDQLCDSKAKDRFNNILKNSSYAPKTTSKNGSGNTAPSSSGAGQSGYNNGTTQCDSNSPSCSYPRLLQTEYDEIATELIEAANALCDDDPSNDAQAMQTINENLARGFYFEDIDDTKCLMYDADFMEYCKEQAGEGSLLWGLLTDFGDYISEIGNGKVSTFDGNAWFPSYSLEISQQGAGYQLILNVDSDWGFGAEVTDLRVAYAATEETAKNYLGSEGNWNWDNIEEWLKSDIIDYNSIEYYYFSYCLFDMSDDEIENVIHKGQKDVSEGLEEMHVPSDALELIARNYREMASAQYDFGVYQSEMKNIPEDMEIIDIEKAKMQEARAIAFYQTVETIKDSDNYYYTVEFNVVKKDDTIGDVYEVVLVSTAKNYQSGDPVSDFDPCANKRKITVYPNGSDLSIVGEDVTKEAMWSLVSPFASGLYGRSDFSSLGVSAVKYMLGKYLGTGDPTGLLADFQSYCDDLDNAAIANGASGALDIGVAARCLAMEGIAVNIDGEQVMVANGKFDENKLAIRAAAYSINNGTEVSADELISSYQEGSETYNNYSSWYFTDGKTELAKYEEVVTFATITCGYKAVSDLSEEELKDVIDLVNQAIEDNGANTVNAQNYDAICDRITEIVG